MCCPRVEMFRSGVRSWGGRQQKRAEAVLPPSRVPQAGGAPLRPPPAAYMTSNVSITSIVEPPARTGQPFDSATAASRLSALMIV